MKREEMGAGACVRISREERRVPRAADEHDLGAEFVLGAVADRGKAIGRPDSGRAAAAGMDEEHGTGGADEAAEVREVGLARFQPHLAADHGDARRRQGAQVVFGDWIRFVLLVRIVDDLRVEGAQPDREAAVVQGEAEGGAGQAGEKGRPLGVVEIEDVRPAGAPQGAEEGGPLAEVPGQEQRLASTVGVERQDAGVGGVDRHRDPGRRPVQAQVAQERAQQHDIAEVAAPNDQDARVDSSGHWPLAGAASAGAAAGQARVGRRTQRARLTKGFEARCQARRSAKYQRGVSRASRMFSAAATAGVRAASRREFLRE